MDGNFGAETTLLSNSSLPELVDLTRREWDFNFENPEMNAQQLFITDDIGSGQGSSKRYQEIDTQKYANVKTEGADAQKAKVGVGYFMDMTSRTFSKEVDITLEMRTHNRYREASEQLTDLTRFCNNRKELDATHRLTFAGDTSYTDMDGSTVTTEVGDGLALGSAAHTLAFSSTTYNNLVTGAPAFSESSLESALLIGATQIYDNFGNKRTKRFNTIATGNDPNTLRTVQQVIKSSADPDAVQAGVLNVYNGKFSHVVLEDLATNATGGYNSAKRRYWFLVAAGQGTRGWQAYIGSWMAPDLVTPSAGNNGEDIHNRNWTFSTACMYGIVTVSPKGIVCSLTSD